MSLLFSKFHNFDDEASKDATFRVFYEYEKGFPTKDEELTDVLEKARIGLRNDNNELVFAASDSEFDIASGANANFSIYLYGDEVEYDRYEVFTTVTYNRNND